MHDKPLPIASEIMNRSVLTFSPDISITAAIERLLARGFSGAPVTDGDGRVVGVLSEKDCMRVLSASAFHGVPNGTVGDHMTRDVVTVRPSADLFQLVFAFHGDAFRRVIVAGDDHKLAGLITRRDVLRALDTLRRERERTTKPSTYEMIAAQHERDKDA